ncbi:MAG: B12-binding domain-containing radical SAM protein [Saccharofermentanales bacterium]
MNILLVRPRPDKETIGLQNVMICEPLELMTLAAVLRRNGHSVEILDMIIERKPFGHFVRIHAPDVVGITGYISHIGVMKSYAQTIKSIALETGREIRVAVGGVHAEVCPEDFADVHIDQVCRSAQDFYEYTGCADTKALLPARDLPDRYRSRYYYLFHSDCALIKTSLGCPYSCRFCFCKEISPYKARDIDSVIEELLSIPQEQIYIVDDDFLFNRDRLLEFAASLRQNGIHKKFLVYGRADFIAHNEDIIEMLKDVGLQAVIVGLEASSQEELDTYNKRTTISDNLDAVRILQKYGIECYATVILGIDWSKAEFDQLYRFLTGMGIVFVNLQPFTPMPKTPYFEEERPNLLIPYEQSEKWDMAHLVVKPTNITVRGFYGQIIRLYFKITLTPKNSAYMIRRYGWRVTSKLSIGAFRVTVQYIRKLIRG